MQKATNKLADGDNYYWIVSKIGSYQSKSHFYELLKGFNYILPYYIRLNWNTHCTALTYVALDQFQYVIINCNTLE